MRKLKTLNPQTIKNKTNRKILEKDLVTKKGCQRNIKAIFNESMLSDLGI